LHTVNVRITEDANKFGKLQVLVPFAVGCQELDNLWPIIRPMFWHKSRPIQLVGEDLWLKYPRFSKGQQLVVVVQVPWNQKQNKEKKLDSVIHQDVCTKIK
jgi:hypothetical protein